MKHLTNKSYWIGWLTLSLLLICCPAIATAQEAAVAEYQQKQKGITAIEQRLLKVVSVNFQDTPIDDVIKILADQGQINITKSPQISGNVTALITDVPLGEALENILAAHGYGCQQQPQRPCPGPDPVRQAKGVGYGQDQFPGPIPAPHIGLGQGLDLGGGHRLEAHQIGPLVGQ